MNFVNIKYSFFSRFFPKLIDSKLLNSYIKQQGVEVGEHTFFFNASSICIDTSRPELLHIGDYCKITAGTTILTHDYSRSVLRRVYGEIIGEAKQTYIGDNVFIGINSIILMGTKIRDNTIIGAGSVCSGSYPANSVIAGNPAKVIMTIEDFYKKRKGKYIYEAKEYARLLYMRNKRTPTVTEMGAFFPLYLRRIKGQLNENKLRTNLSGDDQDEIIATWLSSQPVYEDYDNFIQDCNLEEIDKGR